MHALFDSNTAMSSSVSSREAAVSSSRSKLARLPNWGEAPKMVNHVGEQTPDATRTTRQCRVLFEPHSQHSTPVALTRPIHFRRYDMADPKKQEKDFTKEVDALLPETKALAQVCSLIPT